MANLFFRTCVSPYRVDTYNALHDTMGFELYFLDREDSTQAFDLNIIHDHCHFVPHYIRTIPIIKKSYEYCPDLFDIISSNNPDIVIVPEFKIIAFQVVLYKLIHKSRFKVISMCDDSYDMVSNGKGFSRMHNWARKIIVNFLDNLILVDRKSMQWYQAKYGKGIWLPIIRDEKKEIALYERALPQADIFRKEYALESKKVLLYVGRLVKVKNLEFLLNAINRCISNFTLVIIGDGEEKKELQTVAKGCNHRVVFGGRFEDDQLRAWYNIADVFVLPSYLEPFGAVTNEALIAGCKCAISSLCGSSCLIDEKNGCVFDPYDEVDASMKIDSLMDQIEKREPWMVKTNLMTFSFEDFMNDFKSKLNEL